MKEFTILANGPDGLVTKTVTAATVDDAIKALGPEFVVITISTKTQRA